jgi:putative hemolysin
MKAIDLLRSFLSHAQGLAIVVDEHGGTEGIITLADLVEEIISDAVPQADEALYIEAVGDGELLVSGSARLDDINELLTVKLVAEGLDTISGFIFNRLGTLPRPGTRLDLGGVSLTVRRTSRKRIEEVLIVQHPRTPAAKEDAE